MSQTLESGIQLTEVAQTKVRTLIEAEGRDDLRLALAGDSLGQTDSLGLDAGAPVGHGPDHERRRGRFPGHWRSMPVIIGPETNPRMAVEKWRQATHSTLRIS